MAVKILEVEAPAAVPVVELRVVEAPGGAAEGEPRRYRTGRNQQLSLKVTAEAAESFYALADQTGWVLGEVFERAVEALKRELGGKVEKR